MLIIKNKQTWPSNVNTSVNGLYDVVMVSVAVLLWVFFSYYKTSINLII